MATENVRVDGTDEIEVGSYISPTVDFFLIATVTVIVSVAGVALVVP